MDVNERMKNILETEVIKVERVVKNSAEITAKTVVKNIKSDSPKNTGKYRKGWTYKITKKGVIVFNKKYGNLTHLLEFGHLKVGGVGRVSARPHIKTNEDEGIEIFFNRVKKELINDGR